MSAGGDLPLPGESSARPRKKRMHEAVRDAVPEPVWTLEKWARAGLVYIIAALFGMCLISGGGVKPCATAACQQARTILPAFGTAAATTTTAGGMSP